MKLEEILPDLTAHFPPEDHKERTVKGGGKWWYVPHQAILARLNTVCPGHWSSRYQLSHVEPGGLPIYLCELTICGQTRTGIGDKSNEQSNFGTPAQRSFRDAFADAAEQFGVAAYLDDQSDPKKREAFARFMHQRGHGKPMSELQKEAIAKKRQAAPTSPQPAGTISEAQKKRLWAIAKGAGYTNDGAKALVESFGFESSAAITQSVYDQICEQAASAEQAALFNEKANNKPAPT